MRHRAVLVPLLLGSASLGLGCTRDATGPAVIDPAHLYYQLALNHHAITLALTPPYDTLQLAVTPYAATGVPLATGGVTTWTSSDTTSVRVSAAGLLTAIAATSQITITASQTIGGVTHTATALVNVNDVSPVPHLTSLMLQPDPNFGTINYYDLFGLMQFVPSALDPQGNPISQVLVYETSATPDLMWNRTPGLSWWTGPSSVVFVRGSATGHARIAAEATVYGVRLVDTLPFTIGWWHHAVVGIHAQFPSGAQTPIGVFVPAEDTIAVGGDVIWRNVLSGNDSVDVIFDDPSAAQAVDSATFLQGFGCGFMNLCIPTQGGGNIPAFAPMDSLALRGLSQDTLGVRARSFPVAGTYRYHSARYGTSGVIHVLPEFQIP